jgi:hypothetical protein
MSVHQFDAVVVGARIAGSAIAYQLAKRGWKVALVERSNRPPGGTLSVPITAPRALVRFRDLGLFPAIERVAPRLQPIRSMRMQITDEIVIKGPLPAYAGFDYGYILRRADGRFSRVARLVGARDYNVRQSYTTLYYSYCDGIDMTGLGEVAFVPGANHRLIVFSTTGEGVQVISAFFPIAQYEKFQHQPLAELRASWESAPLLQGRAIPASLSSSLALPPVQQMCEPSIERPHSICSVACSQNNAQ